MPCHIMSPTFTMTFQVAIAETEGSHAPGSANRYVAFLAHGYHGSSLEKDSLGGSLELNELSFFKAMPRGVSSYVTNSQGNGYTSYSDGSYSYSNSYNSNGSSQSSSYYYSNTGSGHGFYSSKSDSSSGQYSSHTNYGNGTTTTRSK